MSANRKLDKLVPRNGVVLWLDASDPSTYILDETGKVVGLRDKAGNGNDLYVEILSPVSAPSASQEEEVRHAD